MRLLRDMPLLALAFLVAFQVMAQALACQPAEDQHAASPEELERLEATQAPIDLDEVDYALLTEAIFHETNERRVENGREPLALVTELNAAACEHAEAMVEQDFFSHRNPANPELATPADRVGAQGLQFSFVAENIGEVFALRYESGERLYVRREGGQTVFSKEPGGEPLGVRSYLAVAETLLDSWMASPGHRANILSEHPESFGAGCQLGHDDELRMPMFRCVQLFFTPLH